MRDDGTRRSPHRRGGAAIDPRDGLTQDESVLRVGEHQDDLRLDREVRERPVERMGQLVLHDRNGGDFVLAYVIEFHHGLERGLQLIRLRGRRAREIVRVEANRAQGVVTGGCREGARRGLRPERASRGNHPLKHRHVVGHDVTEREGHRGQRQLQRRHQLLGVDSTHVTHRGFLSRALSGSRSARHNAGLHIRRFRDLRQRVPPDSISHAALLYHRYGLSFEDVEDLLAAVGPEDARRVK